VLYVAVAMAAWTTACWFSQPFDHPFLGSAVFAIDASIPFVSCLLSLAAALLLWLMRERTEPFSKALQWIRRNRGFAAGLAACLFVYILLQLPAVLMFQGANNADSGQYGVAAYHIASGEIRPMYMIGKHHIGSLLHHATAGMNVLFGRSPQHLRIVTAGAYLGFIVLLSFLSRRLFDNRTALSAAALATLAPYHIYQSTMYTEFPEMLFWGTMSLLIAAAAAERERPKFEQYFWLGMVFGLGLWAHPQMLSFILAALIVLWLKDKLFFLRPQFSGIVPGFTAGGAVILINSYFYFIPHLGGGTQDHAVTGGALNSVVAGVLNFFSYIPTYLGLQIRDSQFLLFHPIVVLTVLLLAAVCLAAHLYSARREIAKAVSFQNFTPRKLVFAVLLLSVFLVFVGSAPIRGGDSARYVFPIWPALAGILAAAVVEVSRKSRIIGYAIAALLVVVFLSSIFIRISVIREREETHSHWLEFCRSNDISRFYGPWVRTYWTNFVSGERIIGANHPYQWEPWLAYQRIVGNADETPAFMFPRRHPGELKKFELILASIGVNYRKADLGVDPVIYGLSKRVTYKQLYGLKRGGYGADITDLRVSAIGGFGGRGGPRLVGITVANAGKVDWLPSGVNGYIELVAGDTAGRELRRAVLHRPVGANEEISWRLLLDSAPLPGGKLRLDIRVNDISITGGGSAVEVDLASATGEPVTAGALSPVRLGGERHNLLDEEFIFFEGWGEKTEKGIWSSGEESSFGFLLRSPRDMELVLRMQPFKSRLMPEGLQQVRFSLNGRELPAAVYLEKIRNIVIKLPADALRAGINTVSMSYGIVEPDFWPEQNQPNLRPRPRAVGVNYLRLRYARHGGS